MDHTAARLRRIRCLWTHHPVAFIALRHPSAGWKQSSNANSPMQRRPPPLRQFLVSRQARPLTISCGWLIATYVGVTLQHGRDGLREAGRGESKGGGRLGGRNEQTRGFSDEDKDKGETTICGACHLSENDMSHLSKNDMSM